MRNLTRPLFLFIVLAALALPACQGQPTAVVGDPSADDMPYSGDYRVTAADARSAFDSGKAVVIDTRSLTAYNASRVKGAISMPYGEEATRYTELDTGKWIVAYCT